MNKYTSYITKESQTPNCSGKTPYELHLDMHDDILEWIDDCPYCYEDYAGSIGDMQYDAYKEGGIYE